MDAFSYAAANFPAASLEQSSARHVRASAADRVTPCRSGRAQFQSEFVATFGLMCVIWAARGRARLGHLGWEYITLHMVYGVPSFANPAVTIARSLTTLPQASSGGCTAIHRCVKLREGNVANAAVPLLVLAAGQRKNVVIPH